MRTYSLSIIMLGIRGSVMKDTEINIVIQIVSGT